jgi:syncollin
MPRQSKLYLIEEGEMRKLTYILVGCTIFVNSTGAFAEAKKCTIFEHINFGGAHFTLHNGDYLQMIDPPDVGTSDAIHRYIYRSAWNDQVSSFKVSGGCTLTLWEHVNRGGHRFRSNKSYKYVGDGWNDRASEAICECAGLPNW